MMHSDARYPLKICRAGVYLVTHTGNLYARPQAVQL